MKTVFGAGIATGLEEAPKSEEIYSRTKASVGCSGGAFDESYWISGQTRLGSSIYYEDLPSFFINKPQVIPAFASRLWHGERLNSLDKKIIQAIDVDGLMSVMKTKKILDVDAINNSEIPSFVSVMDVEEGRINYIDLKGDVLKNLKRAAHLFPYYYDPSEGNFLDAGLFDVIGYDKLRETFPNEKIIFVINYGVSRNSKNSWKSHLEGLIADRMFPKRGFLGIMLGKEQRFRDDIQKIRGDPNALLVHPPENSPTSQSTTDPVKIRITYQMGIDATRKIIDWI